MMLKMNAMAASMMVLASSADSFMPLLLVLIIGGAILSVVFRVLINRGVNKGVDSVAQKKEMQKMQEKVERGENAEKYLRELYPEYQPNPKKPGVKNPLDTLPKKLETTISKPTISAPSQDHTDRCCICGDPLESKYAILFRTADGREMRADRKCYEALYDLGTSEDMTVLAEAKRYILEKETSDSQSELSDYLKKYLSSADVFLAQASEQRDSKEQRDS